MITNMPSNRACPNKPNCVSSYDTRSTHFVAPLAMSADPKSYSQRVLEAFTKLRIRVDQHTFDGKNQPAENVAEELIRGYAKSRVFKFVDTVDVWINYPEKKIYFKSASQTGYYDFKVNRKRIEKLIRLISQA